MRGHWQSQTRKLNRHYQSGDGSGLTKWNPLAGCLHKVTKGGVAYYPAPSYCVLQNGSMLQEIFWNRQYSASGVAGVEISEEQQLEYVPYFPKTSDNYYIGVGLQNVTWEAEQAFDVIQPDSQETVVTFLTGENLNSKNANLLKLTYAGFTARKQGAGNLTQQEYKALCDALYAQFGNAQIDGRGHYTGQPVPAFYPENMTGTFTAYSSDNIGFMSEFVGNSGIYTYSLNINAFKYPAFTVQPQYRRDMFWSGKQTVKSMVAPSITPYITADQGGLLGMHGFASGSGRSIPTGVYDVATGYTYFVLQVLKKVEGVTCPITG